jgi:hypothetical protein
MARAPSTDPDLARRFPGARDHRAVNGAQAVLEAQLGVRGVTAIDRTLADPRGLRERLARLPAASLMALELLLEMGGSLDREQIVSLAPVVLGLSAEHAERALTLAVAEGLLLQVTLTYGNAPSITAWMVTAQAAAPLAALVIGVSRPPPPPPLAMPTDPLPLRDFLAVLTTTAHTSLTVTTAGTLHRAGLKKIAAKTGVPLERLEADLNRGRSRGHLGVRDLALAPVLEQARLAVLTPEEDGVGAEWVSVESLARRRVAQGHLAFRRIRRDEDDAERGLAEQLRLARADIAAQASLVCVEHQGHSFVRDRPEAGLGGWDDATGDGHVTPALEVMLGPAAHPRMALEVGCFAELSRLDKVLTFRLTPASIAAGLALGLDADTMVAVLAKVGRHGVPANVSVSVRDFARAAKFARVSVAHVVEASSGETADLLAVQLGALVLSRPTSTLLLVSGTAETAEVARIVAKAGVGTSAPVVPRVVGPPHRRVQSVEKSTPDPELRERVRSTPNPSADLTALSPGEVGASGPTATLTLEIERRRGEGPAALAFLRAVRGLWAAVEGEFLAWTGRLRPAHRGEALALAAEAPLTFLPLLVLDETHRRLAFRGAHEFDTLLDAATRVRDRGSYSPEGNEVMALLLDPAVERLHEETLEANALRSLFGALGAEPPAAPRRQPSAPSGPWTRKSPPKPTDLVPESSSVLQKKLETLAGKPLWLRIRSKSSGERVLRYAVERLLVRGREVTVLGTDLDQELGRSFPLANIVAAVPFDG